MTNINSNWICADPDTNQYARRITETKFELYQTDSFFEDTRVFHETIDVGDYLKDPEGQEELRVALGMFGYSGWLDLETQYGEDTWQIAAECLFESYFTDGTPETEFPTEEEAVKYIHSEMTKAEKESA